MLEKMLVGLLSLWSKHLLKNQLIHFVSEHLIRKRVWISTRELCKPLDCLLGKLVQPRRAQPLLAVYKQRPILWTERIVNRWSRRPLKGRENAMPSARQETGTSR